MRESQLQEKGNSMKKSVETVKDTDMLEEYNFSKGVRGRYSDRFAGVKSDVVVLAPDVADIFEDSKSVNDALRLIVKAAKKQIKNVAA